MNMARYLRRLGYLMCGVVLSGSLMGAQLVEATTYYVATTGSNSNPGTQASPFRTINRGVKVLKPGDTLRVKSGTYAEALLNPLPSGLSASQPTTLEGDPAPNWPVLKPRTSRVGTIIRVNQGRSNIRIRNLVLDGRGHGTSPNLYGALGVGASTPITGFTLENCEAIGRNGVVRTGAAIYIAMNAVVTVRNCSIHGWRSNESNPGAHGFYWSGSNGLIENNEIYDNNGFGLQFYRYAGGVNNNVFRNNYVHDNGTGLNGGAMGGLYIATGSGNLAYNNIFSNNNKGVWFTSAGRDNHLWNNTIYNNTTYGIQITGGSGTIHNTIVYQNKTNIYHKGGGPTLSHNLTTDPQFVSAASGNFRLQSSSPGIDTGVTLAEVRTDFDGKSRPKGSAYDIGAYEYTGSTSTSPVAAPANLRVLGAD